MQIGSSRRVGRPRGQPHVAVRRALRVGGPVVGKAIDQPGGQQRRRDRRPRSGSGAATTATAGGGLEHQHRRNGLVVNGDDVTMYGLFVEHCLTKYQTIWNGNGGRTYFYQNEMPYDPPNQAAGDERLHSRARPPTRSRRLRHHPPGLGGWAATAFFNVKPRYAPPTTPSRSPSSRTCASTTWSTVSLGGVGTHPVHVINDRGAPFNSPPPMWPTWSGYLRRRIALHRLHASRVSRGLNRRPEAGRVGAVAPQLPRPSAARLPGAPPAPTSRMALVPVASCDWAGCVGNGPT